MNIIETTSIKDFKLFGITIFSIDESKTHTIEEVKEPIKVSSDYYKSEFEV